MEHDWHSPVEFRELKKFNGWHLNSKSKPATLVGSNRNIIEPAPSSTVGLIAETSPSPVRGPASAKTLQSIIISSCVESKGSTPGNTFGALGPFKGCPGDH